MNKKLGDFKIFKKHSRRECGEGSIPEAFMSGDDSRERKEVGRPWRWKKANPSATFQRLFVFSVLQIAAYPCCDEFSPSFSSAFLALLV